MERLHQLYRDLFRERTRILLTIMAIAWGTASITLMLAMGEGLRQMFGRSMRGMGENILIVWPGQTSKAFGGLPEGHRIPLSKADLASVQRRVLEMESISPEYGRTLAMRAGEAWRTGNVSGVWPEYGDMRNIILEDGGRFINKTDIQEHRRVIVLGNDTKKELYPNGGDPVGQTIEIENRRFLVIGVMAKKFQSSSYRTNDRLGAWMPATTMEVMLGMQHAGNWVVRPHAPEQMELMKAAILEVVALNHGANPEDDEVLKFWDTAESGAITSKIFGGLEIVLGVLGALTLIVAGVGIANVMYVSVKNATREIGIRMAVGARDGEILTKYVSEGLMATALGGAIGLAASTALVALLGYLPLQGEFFDQVGKPLPVMSPVVAGVVVTVLGAIGFLAGFFPARRAAHVNPSEALRYE